jgi:hypothetical protein
MLMIRLSSQSLHQIQAGLKRALVASHESNLPANQVVQLTSPGLESINVVLAPGQEVTPADFISQYPYHRITTAEKSRLFPTSSKLWLFEILPVTPVQAIQDIESYDPSKQSSAQRADDWRILVAHYATSLSGKDSGWPKEMIVSTAKKLAKYMSDKDSVIFHPDKMTHAGQELFYKIGYGLPHTLPKSELDRTPGMISSMSKQDLSHFHRDLHLTWEAGPKTELIANIHKFVVEAGVRCDIDDTLAKALPPAVKGVSATVTTEIQGAELPPLTLVYQAVSLVGSSVYNKSIPHDVDLLFRYPVIVSSLEASLLCLFPEREGHILIEQQGPNWDYVPLGDLVLMQEAPALYCVESAPEHLPELLAMQPVLVTPDYLCARDTTLLVDGPHDNGLMLKLNRLYPDYTVCFNASENTSSGGIHLADLWFMPYPKVVVVHLAYDKDFIDNLPSKTQAVSASISPGHAFAPTKAKAGYHIGEFYSEDDLSKFWATPERLSKGIVVQPKADGIRMVIHKRGDKVWIFTEDKRRDRAAILSDLAQAVKKLSHESLIMDTEVIEYDKNLPVPRHEMVELAVSNSAPKHPYIAWVHDLLYVDGKDLSDTPYSERLKQLNTLHISASQDLLASQYSRTKCMECDAPPTKDIRWAEGIGRAWFCDAHFESFKKNHPGEIDYVHDISGEAPLKFNASQQVQAASNSIIRVMPTKIAHNHSDFSSAIAWASAVTQVASEGAMVKTVDALYAPDSPDWAKLKNVAELKVKVIGISLKSSPWPGGKSPASLEKAPAVDAYKSLTKDSTTVRLRCAILSAGGKLMAIESDHVLSEGDLGIRWSDGEWRGLEDPALWSMGEGFSNRNAGELAYGSTYAKSFGDTLPRLGDIVTVRPMEMRFFEADGKTHVAWMFPTPQEIDPSRNKPDTIADVSRIVSRTAKRHGASETIGVTINDLPEHDLFIEIDDVTAINLKSSLSSPKEIVFLSDPSIIQSIRAELQKPESNHHRLAHVDILETQPEALLADCYNRKSTLALIHTKKPKETAKWLKKFYGRWVMASPDPFPEEVLTEAVSTVYSEIGYLVANFVIPTFGQSGIILSSTQAAEEEPTRDEQRAGAKRAAGYDFYVVQQKDTSFHRFIMQYHCRGILTPEDLKLCKEALHASKDDKAELSKVWNRYGLVHMPTGDYNTMVKALQEADDSRGDVSATLGRYIKDAAPDILPPLDEIWARGNAHVDLRMLHPSGKFLVGWTNDTVKIVLQPVTSGKLNFPLRDRILRNVEGDNWSAQQKASQPLVWASLVSPSSPMLWRPAGSVGATTNTAACFVFVASGEMVFGVQKAEHYHEYFLRFDSFGPVQHLAASSLDGRWDYKKLQATENLSKVSPVYWQSSRPWKTQAPYITTHDFSEEQSKERAAHRQFAWNETTPVAVDKLLDTNYAKELSEKQSAEKAKEKEKEKKP